MFQRISKVFNRRNHSGKAKQAEHYRDILDDPLTEHPWSREFDMSEPEDRKKVKKIAELSDMPGQEFQVFKLSRVVEKGYARPGLSGSPVVAEFVRFPLASEVWEVSGDVWGGGTYGVRAITQPSHLLKTYTFPGPAKRPGSEQSRRASQRASAKKALEDQLIESALPYLQQNKPEILAALGREILGRRLGVPVPELPEPLEPSLIESVVEEAFETDPEFRRPYTERLIAAQFGEEESGDQMTNLLQALEQLNEVKRIMGWERDQDKASGAGGLAEELVRNLPEILSSAAKSIEEAKQRPKPGPGTQYPGPQQAPAAQEMSGALNEDGSEKARRGDGSQDESRWEDDEWTLI